MAHDRQMPQEETSSIALSKQPKTSQDVVLNWLRLYQAMPYMRGEHQITEEVILFYCDSLNRLNNPAALHRAFQWCRDHINFLPQPKEILEAYGRELEKLEPKTAPDSCELCRGTGWKLIKRADGDGECATRCIHQ